MFRFLRNLRRRQLIKKHPIPGDLWQKVWESYPALHRLNEYEEQRLSEMAAIFLQEKQFLPSHGWELDEYKKICVSVLACLPVLNLGLDWYDGWSTIILTPQEFPFTRKEMDSAGVMHEMEEELGGQVMELGPVVLSWKDVDGSGKGYGFNVVVHEMVHKIDGRHGDVDGVPSLPRNISPGEWKEAFSRAYYDFQEKAERDPDGCGIDPYGATAPEEFLAVTSEYFFDCPQVLYRDYPQVYQLLSRFFRQEPIEL